MHDDCTAWRSGESEGRVGEGGGETCTLEGSNAAAVESATSEQEEEDDSGLRDLLEDLLLWDTLVANKISYISYNISHPFFPPLLPLFFPLPSLFLLPFPPFQAEAVTIQRLLHAHSQQLRGSRSETQPGEELFHTEPPPDQLPELNLDLEPNSR